MNKLSMKQKNELLKEDGKQLRLFALKLKLKPNKEQKELINKTIGCSRLIFNQYLNDRNEFYKINKSTLKPLDYKKEVLNPQKKTNDYSFLKDIDKFALEFALTSVQEAFNRFYTKQCKFPKFKSKKNSKQSYTTNFTNNNIRLNLEKQTIQLPKLKEVPFVIPNFSKTSKKRDLLERLDKGLIKIMKATISKNSDNYFVSITLEEIVNIVNKIDYSEIDFSKVIGIDLGLKDFAIINNGIETTKIDNPKYYKKAEKKLAKLNKRLAKKELNSNNFLKAKKKLNKHHTYIKNQREDFLHKLSRKIVNENQVIVLENLNIKGMVKNRKLSKAISDAGWYKFITYLSYKTEWEGKYLIQVDRFYASSKLCSVCGSKNIMLTLNNREWICSKCHTKHDRDENASINIRKEGIRILEKTLLTA